MSVSMRERLPRARKVAGIPISISTAKSLTRAAADIVTNKRVDLAERERRYNICLRCPERTHDRCNLCGCFLKAKTIFKNSKCPINKWSTLLSEAAINDTCCAETDEKRTNNPTQIS